MLKLMMTRGLHLDLFTLCLVNNLSIDKDEAVDLKEKIPPPLLLMHPVINSVQIQKLITEVNLVHVIIV